MEQKKIFITGVAGFLGSHLAEMMLSEGYAVVGCDNLSGGYLDNVPKGVDFHEVDCNDFEKMKELTKGVDVVYHCAAAAYEGLSVFSPLYVARNVFENSISVFTAAAQNRVRRVVFCSSMARYGKNQVPFREDMIPNPEDPYGACKLAAEKVLKTLAEAHGMEYAIAVPHNIIGPRQKYDDPYRNVASIMINLMLHGRQPIIYGDGEQKRCFSFVGDVIYCLEQMGFNEKANGQIINVGPDEEFVSINQLAKAIAGLLDFELKPIYHESRPLEVKLATCSADKARRLLGYKTSTTLKEGLQEIIDYIKQRGTKEFQYHIDLEIINGKTPKTWKNKLF